MADATDPVTPDGHGYLATCYACESPTLVGDLQTEATRLRCPRCGTVIRPCDIWEYRIPGGQTGGDRDV